MRNLAKVILSLLGKYKKNNDTSNIEKLSTRVDILFAAGSLSDEEYETIKDEFPHEEF